MKSIYCLILLSILIAHTATAADVTIAFPPQGSTLSAGEVTFVIGKVTPPGSSLEINGQKITPYRTGSFLTMTPITPGKNTLHIKSGADESDHIFYRSQPKITTAAPKIEALFPIGPSGVMTGKTFKVSCKAPAGLTIQAQVGERILILQPEAGAPNYYTGELTFNYAINEIPVTLFSVKLPDVHAGSLTALAEPQAYTVTGKLFEARARSQRDVGETIAFLSPGDIVPCIGYTDAYRKMVINAQECYVHNKHLEQVPQGSSAALKQTDIKAGYGPFPPTKKSPKEMLIVLDAGHGGTESGAVGPSGVKEKEITLKQVLLLKNVFEKAGYQILLTRSKDEYVGLYDRVRLGYNKKADAFISIHYNSCPSMYSPLERRHISTYAWNNIGKELAQPISAELGKVSPTRNAGVLYGNFAICRNPAVPSILIELDFITTPEGEELIQTAQFQRKAAEAILKGVQAWCGK